MHSKARLSAPPFDPCIFIVATLLLACSSPDDGSDEMQGRNDASTSTAGNIGASASDANALADGGTHLDSAVAPADVDGGPNSASHATDARDSGAPRDAEAGAGDADRGVTETGAGGAGSDDVLGSSVARKDAFWIGDGRIHYGERELRLYGLNWFGLETDARALFGIQEAKRSVADFLSQIKGLGFNALRIPLSPESIDPGFPNPDWAKRGDIDTGREQFEELAKAAKDAGIYMLWDIHTCSSAVGYRKTGPTNPACTGYGKDKWLANLATLADLALGYAPYVVGIDLFNEPYGLTWDAWKALAEEGGRVVLKKNPRILTFVEGVGSEGYQGTDPVFWGENLTGVQESPVDLPASRLVYSPHVYGPSVFAQPYFSASGFPANMPSIWDSHFGYLMNAGTAMVPGELGGKYTASDKTWQDAFVDYLQQRSTTHSFFYWCLNPNSGDTGGLLMDDWKTVNQDKLNLLKRLQQ